MVGKLSSANKKAAEVDLKINEMQNALSLKTSDSVKNLSTIRGLEEISLKCEAIRKASLKLEEIKLEHDELRIGAKNAAIILRRPVRSYLRYKLASAALRMPGLSTKLRLKLEETASRKSPRKARISLLQSLSTLEMQVRNNSVNLEELKLVFRA